MAKIFMSHSSRDKPFVRRLSEDLKAAGHEPWLDEWEIKVGECIVSKISHGINEADYAVIVLTPDSVTSGWVDREWTALYGSEIQEVGIKVLPILLRKCEIPALLRSKGTPILRHDTKVVFPNLSRLYLQILASAYRTEGAI